MNLFPLPEIVVLDSHPYDFYIHLLANKMKGCKKVAHLRNANRAIGLFEDKYADKVQVVSIGKYSKEICAGPHVKNTKELKHFKIKKEKSSAAGIRRIKAVLD